MKNPRLRYALLLALTIAVLAALAAGARDSWARLENKTPHWPTALAALSLTALFPFCMALRWGAILRAAGHRVGFQEAAALTMAVWPLGTITPSKTGDIGKAWGVRDRVPLAAGLGSVVVERALDVLVLLALSALGALALNREDLAAIAGGVLFAGLACCAVAAFGLRLPGGGKWAQRLEQFSSTARAVLRRPRWLALSAAAAAANWLLSVWQTQLLFRAYGADPSFGFVAAALPMAIFVGLTPITLAGMGTRDAALIFLFRAAGVPDAVSLCVGIWYSLAGYWLPSLVGLPFMRRLIRFRDAGASRNGGGTDA